MKYKFTITHVKKTGHRAPLQYGHFQQYYSDGEELETNEDTQDDRIWDIITEDDLKEFGDWLKGVMPKSRMNRGTMNPDKQLTKAILEEGLQRLHIEEPNHDIVKQLCGYLGHPICTDCEPIVDTFDEESQYFLSCYCGVYHLPISLVSENKQKMFQYRLKGRDEFGLQVFHKIPR